MSVPGFSAAASLYRAKNYYQTAGPVDPSGTGAVLLADVQCPPPRQECGGPPFGSAFCCPPQAPVCCDPSCLPGSPLCTACCPLSHPDCCRAAPSPGDSNGEPLPRPPDFFCPSDREPCGVLGRGEGQPSRQACCESGQRCCDPDTHFCCPSGTTKCCRPRTPNSIPVDVCCKPGEVCFKPGLCCPAGRGCNDTCCTATQTCTLDGCCNVGKDCGGHCCKPGQCCVKRICTDTTFGTNENCKFCGNKCSPLGTCCPQGCVVPDILNNSSNCGACGKACARSQICSSGHCCPPCTVWLGPAAVGRLKLRLGFPLGLFVGGPGCHSCDDFATLTGVPRACCGGVCTPLNTSTDCAACGDNCAKKDPNKTCVNGKCVCLPGLRECGHLCVDTQTDAGNCGQCFKTCAPGEICCAGQCVNPKSDANHCGDCPISCLGPGGKCCDGSCVDSHNDPHNCGSCGTHCGSGECNNGSCAPIG